MMRQVLHDILSACCSSLLREVAVTAGRRPRSVRMRLKTTASQEPVPACRSLHETVAARSRCPPTSVRRSKSYRFAWSAGASRRLSHIVWGLQ